MDNLAFALAFTETYDRNRYAHPAVRELECLRVQLPAALVAPKLGDMFCGRTERFPISFRTRNKSGHRGFAYACDMDHLERMAADESLPLLARSRTSELIEYWRDEQTAAKIRAAYTPSMKALLPHDDLNRHFGIACPLYRLAGPYLDFGKLLRLGLNGLQDEVRLRIQQSPAPNPVLSSMLGLLELLQGVCRDYAALARNTSVGADPECEKELRTMASVLDKLAVSRPESLREAIQLVWLYVQSSTVLNYGRLDVILGPFLANDIETGVLTEDEALDLLVGLWRLMAERNTIWDGRVFIGGMGRPDPDSADRFALLALEATRRVPGGDPQLSLRWHAGMSPAIMDKSLDLLGEGRTFPILYNDDANVPAVQKAFGVDRLTAEHYLPFGCGEYVIEHESLGTPNSVMNLLKALEVSLHDGVDLFTGDRIGPKCAIDDLRTFEDLFAAYSRTSEQYIEALADQEAACYRVAGEEAAFLEISILYDDCIARGKALLSGGVRYLGGTIEAYGNTNTADSLTAIKTVVFGQKRVTLPELVAALDADFVGHEDLRKVMLEAPKYGNNDDAADKMAVRVHEHFCRSVMAQASRVGLDSYLTVVINNSFNTDMGRQTGASADGRRLRQPLTNANAASAGCDRRGLTALLHSLVKLSPDIHAGVVQNMKFGREMFTTQRSKMLGLLLGYFNMGGTQAMITVVDRGELERAMEHPELYPNLFVRVGGFSARFIDLPRDVQCEILSRTLYA